MRAIWTGAIGFGLVNIPVKMYSAVESSSLDLDMLDKHDNGKIRYQRVNEKTGEEVAWGDIVKGYMLNDAYVILTDKDFEEASPKKSQVIGIEEFAAIEDVEVMYYDKPYYLAPSKGGERAYALLRDALAGTKKIAIGNYVMRGREHLCLLRSVGDALVLLQIRFAEEIRAMDELELPETSKPKPAEMKMAKSLISQMTAKKLNLEKYKDTYNADLLKLIKARAKGKKPAKAEFKMVKTKAKDLMAELKASLNAKKAS